ncbi:GDSL-type esterase/lipase family protein [Actinomyces trachealis]|uniref:GDSL-type esterase/lipase family protein n=1 Tax=Actinomyces trachealis TaxID=2763540 RepID=UPI001892B3CF|nr:GDSL-type esterase/lipase family protein [Actinomyces trachealis]
MRSPQYPRRASRPVHHPLHVLSALALAGVVVVTPLPALAQPAADYPDATDAAVSPQHAAPQTLEQWDARNRALPDHAHISRLLGQPAPVSWVLAGDSITQGVWHSHGMARFADYFGSYLRTDGAQGQARSQDTVTNTGVSSAKSSDLVGNLDTWVTGYRPQVVVMSVGMNDALQKVPLETYRGNLRQALKAVRDQGGVPVLQTQNYTKKTNGFNDTLDRYFTVMREVALETDTVLVDVARFWRDTNNGQAVNPYLMGDDIHPNERGHLLWAQLLLRTLGALEPTSPLGQLRPEDVTVSHKLAWADPQVAAVGASATPPVDAKLGLDLDRAFTGDPKETITKPAPWLAQAKEATFVVRTRLGASATDTVLLNAGDPASTKKVSLKVRPDGQLRVHGNLGQADGWYTLQSSLRDGRWHTISVTITGSSIHSYVDGQPLRQVSFKPGEALTPDVLGAEEITVGAQKDVNTAGELFLVGDIDYVAVYDRALGAQEHTALPGATRSDLAAALAPLVANKKPSTWLYLGGRTTEGATRGATPAFTRGYVGLVDEVLRWEHGDAKKSMEQRAKFALNLGRVGATSTDLLASYQALAAPQRPAVLVVVPDVLEAGRVVEDSPQAFKDNLRALAAKAKGDGAVVVLATPPQLGEAVDQYAQAVREVADTDGVHLIDTAAWLKGLNSVYPDLPSLWFTDGVLNHAGHLMLTEHLMEQMGTIPGGQSEVRGLEDKYFDKTNPARRAEPKDPEPQAPDPAPDPQAPDPQNPEPQAPSKPAYVAAAEARGAKVLLGDWDGDGVRTYAVRVGSRVVFYNRNETAAPVYATVSLGRATDEVLVGDWDGQGRETLALRRGTTVVTQQRLTATATSKVTVPGITRTSPLQVKHEPGKPDTIVVAP